jgi:hypothetical protein
MVVHCYVESKDEAARHWLCIALWEELKIIHTRYCQHGVRVTWEGTNPDDHTTEVTINIESESTFAEAWVAEDVWDAVIRTHERKLDVEHRLDTTPFTTLTYSRSAP